MSILENTADTTEIGALAMTINGACETTVLTQTGLTWGVESSSWAGNAAMFCVLFLHV